MDKFRIFIIDDTVTYRKILTESINRHISEAEISGTSASGSNGIQKLKFTPTDLVLLDIEMPGMNGLDTLKEINKNFPDLSVVMISGVNTHDADITISALEEGALEFIPKRTDNKSIEEGMRLLAQDIKKVIHLVQEKKNNKRSSTKLLDTTNFCNQTSQVLPTNSLVPVSKKSVFSLLVIGCSTGGPKALYDIIPQINPNLGCPILIVQHMPPPFTKKLAEHLDSKTQMTAKEATTNGEIIKPNHIYVAPAGYHMTIKKFTPSSNSTFKILLNQDPPVHSCRPSVDVLFKSVAQCVSTPIVSLVLTGMGTDGANGVQAMKESLPCYSIAQDRSSSTVYGMPKAVVERKLADESLHISRIPKAINELFNKQSVPVIEKTLTL